jgi:hypothetical protein
LALIYSSYVTFPWSLHTLAIWSAFEILYYESWIYFYFIFSSNYFIFYYWFWIFYYDYLHFVYNISLSLVIWLFDYFPLNNSSSLVLIILFFYFYNSFNTFNCFYNFCCCCRCLATESVIMFTISVKSFT